MSDGKQRIGVMQVSLSVLADLLNLPAGHEIRAVSLNSANPHELTFTVEGPSLPETPVFSLPPRVRLALILQTREVREVTATLEPIPDGNQNPR